MWKRIALAAGVAGLVAGLVLTAIQVLGIEPLIRTAEVIAEAGLAPDRDLAPEPPRGDTERRIETGVANIVLATGFALIIAAGMTLRGQGGWRAGLAWALAGYFVVFVAPAVGLPPELPGTESAPLTQRTVWWVVAVGLTALGLALVVFAPRPAWRVAGVVLAALPHLFGAPHGVTQALTATDDLTNEFIVVTALANAVFWLLIGLVAGALYHPEKAVPREPV
ncbi:MAG TPA: CbtA family protein [Usitatibacter sp.]|nr:CbtA family protein [Usitatibacter sp.]